MSLLSGYRKYAPFTADRLIEAANSLLPQTGVPEISKRTLRFYTAQGVVPRPLGSPKFARYGFEHLLTLLAARALQDRGMKLHQIVNEVEEIRRGQFARMESVVEDWIRHTNAIYSHAVREPLPQDYDQPDTLLAEQYGAGQLQRVINLSPSTSLSISGKAVLKEELDGARKAIESLLKQIG